jgi:hypothetical protein
MNLDDPGNPVLIVSMLDHHALSGSLHLRKGTPVLCPPTRLGALMGQAKTGSYPQFETGRSGSPIRHQDRVVMSANYAKRVNYAFKKSEYVKFLTLASGRGILGSGLRSPQRKASTRVSTIHLLPLIKRVAELWLQPISDRPDI